jgi:hypothetical protein
MKTKTTIIHNSLLVFAVLFALKGNAQNCPGFQPGNPANNIYSVGFFNLADLQIGSCNCQYTGNGFKCGSCLPTGFTTYRYISSGVNIVCLQVPLPVELKEFNAIVQNGDVQLNWATESERDNSGFILERSSDAIDFTFFTEKKGAINSTVVNHYYSEDTDPLKGIVYYRLSQRDTDGKITRLAIVSVETSSPLSGTLIAPNPSSGIVKLQLPLHNDNEMFDVAIADATGKKVWSFQTAADLEFNLMSGVYSVVVSLGSQSWQEKLVVFN